LPPKKSGSKQLSLHKVHKVEAEDIVAVVNRCDEEGVCNLGNLLTEDCRHQPGEYDDHLVY